MYVVKIKIILNFEIGAKKFTRGLFYVNDIGMGEADPDAKPFLTPQLERQRLDIVHGSRMWPPSVKKKMDQGEEEEGTETNEEEQMEEKKATPERGATYKTGARAKNVKKAKQTLDYRPPEVHKHTLQRKIKSESKFTGERQRNARCDPGSFVT